MAQPVGYRDWTSCKGYPCALYALRGAGAPLITSDELGFESLGEMCGRSGASEAEILTFLAFGAAGAFR